MSGDTGEKGRYTGPTLPTSDVVVRETGSKVTGTTTSSPVLQCLVSFSLRPQIKGTKEGQNDTKTVTVQGGLDVETVLIPSNYRRTTTTRGKGMTQGTRRGETFVGEKRSLNRTPTNVLLTVCYKSFMKDVLVVGVDPRTLLDFDLFVSSPFSRNIPVVSGSLQVLLYFTRDPL